MGKPVTSVDRPELTTANEKDKKYQYGIEIVSFVDDKFTSDNEEAIKSVFELESNLQLVSDTRYAVETTMTYEEMVKFLSKNNVEFNIVPAKLPTKISRI